MILHIISDEIFIDALINIMDRIDRHNHLYVLLQNNKSLIKNIKNKNRIKIINVNSIEYYRLIKESNNYKAIIIHFLDKIKYDFVKDLPNEVNLVWIAWGADFYSLCRPLREKLFDKETRDLFYKLNNIHPIISAIKKTWLYKRPYLEIRQCIKNKEIAKVIGKFKYYSSPIPEEKEIIEKALKLKAKYLHFNYGFNEDILTNNINQSINGSNILVGNSGTYFNNHMSILKFLSDKLPPGCRIIAPLSYGDERYIQEIVTIGKKIFGGSFIPLLEFLPLREYFELLKTCSICIFNHYRQQGVGALVLMIWLGAKVFLSINNPFYHFCRKRGIKVYSIEEDLFNGNINDIFRGLSDVEITENKNKIYEFGSPKAIENRDLFFIEAILDQK